MVTLDGISRVRIEEAMMMEAFGDEYRAYMRRTGRFLPRLSRSS
jgi:protein-S-isoprenylcysteine O-methyltransferase Ste14